MIDAYVTIKDDVTLDVEPQAVLSSELDIQVLALVALRERQVGDVVNMQVSKMRESRNWRWKASCSAPRDIAKSEEALSILEKVDRRPGLGLGTAMAPRTQHGTGKWSAERAAPRNP